MHTIHTYSIYLCVYTETMKKNESMCKRDTTNYAILSEKNDSLTSRVWDIFLMENLKGKENITFKE